MMLPCIGQIYIIFPFPRTPPDAEQQGGKDGIGSNWLFALASHTQELQINQQAREQSKHYKCFKCFPVPCLNIVNVRKAPSQGTDLGLPLSCTGSECTGCDSKC